MRFKFYELCLTLPFLSLAGLVSARPLQSSTPTPSPSPTDHGNPNLACKRATFSDIAVFYLANYFAHCATVKMAPGESALHRFASAAIALFFPTSGIIKAMTAIVRHARFPEKDELTMATRAGALCMLVRTRDWRPRNGDVVRQCRTTTSQKAVNSGGWKYEFHSKGAKDLELQKTPNPPPKLPPGMIPMSVWDPYWMAETLPIRASKTVYPLMRKVHGNILIPEGYRLAPVPSDARIASLTQNINTEERSSPHYSTVLAISSSYNLPKVIIAITQTIYAAVTLYRTRGDQIAVFGYAAFGLTVTPYIIMSMVNLVAQIATPDYDALYLVRSDIMTEAEKRGGVFDGTIGKLVHEEIVVPDPRSFGGVVRQEQGTETFLLDPVLSSPVLDPKVRSDPNDELLSPGNSSEGIFFPIHAITARGKDQAGSYEEWLYVPSCTPFRRSSAITDGIVVPPWKSLNNADIVSSNIDRADNGYALRNGPGTEGMARSLFRFWIPLFISSLCIVIIGVLSHFNTGKSTKPQRAWIMSWLIAGMVIGPIGHSLGKLLISWARDFFAENLAKGSTVIGAVLGAMCSMIVVLGIFGILFAPAMGGLVVVGKMIQHYGTCVETA